MKLSRNDTFVEGKYHLIVEPTECIDIFFDPRGVNACPGSILKQAMSIGTVTLPNGDLALTISFDGDLLYKRVQDGTYPGLFVLCDDLGAARAEFVLNEACPRVVLVLEKVDWRRLLKSSKGDDHD